MQKAYVLLGLWSDMQHYSSDSFHERQINLEMEKKRESQQATFDKFLEVKKKKNSSPVHV